MAITANITTNEGTSIESAYLKIGEATVKKFDDTGWKLIYSVLIWKDKATRDDEEKKIHMKLKTSHLDRFKVDYDDTSTTNPVALAYADLKTNEALSNVADA
jgi:superfamily II helicase